MATIDIGQLVSLALLTPLIVVLYILAPMFWGAGYAPSPRKEVARVLRYAIDKYLAGKRELHIVDLGSGFGGVCFESLKLDIEIRCTGVEIDPIKVLWSRAMARAKGYSGRARFIRGNLFDTQLECYDIIYMFLWPPTVARVEDKILREARKMVVVISLEHPLTRIKSERYGNFYVGCLVPHHINPSTGITQQHTENCQINRYM